MLFIRRRWTKPKRSCYRIRTAPEVTNTTPLPIDVISSKGLTSTGQATLTGITVQNTVFNTVQNPVNDATSLLDPYEIKYGTK
jgi:iron complex outermembrane receptor protein